MLDDSRAVYDRQPMTDIQNQIARRRLILGISNVGFWVAVSAAGLLWGTFFGPPFINQPGLLKCMLGIVVTQSFFDFIGGAVFMPQSSASRPQFFRTWFRGALVHSALLCGAAVLSYWSFLLTHGFYLSVAVVSLGLFFCRRQILSVTSGGRSTRSTFGGCAGWEVDSRDPSFTGGISGIGPGAMTLMPESWKSTLTSEEIHTLIQRRLWAIKNNLPARALVTVLSWNLAGCKIGSLLLGLPSLSPEQAMLMQCAWMTLWGFLALLLLPSLSRSSVFGADRAAAAQGCDATSWIQKFPSLTGEDGNAKTLLQRIFYPIPSAAERLVHLEDSKLAPVFGSVARSNLFLSLATLTILGRCVHCNVGRPELWIFPPSD
jgi:hypothetical protein